MASAFLPMLKPLGKERKIHALQSSHCQFVKPTWRVVLFPCSSFKPGPLPRDVVVAKNDAIQEELKDLSKYFYRLVQVSFHSSGLFGNRRHEPCMCGYKLEDGPSLQDKNVPLHGLTTNGQAI